MRIEAEGLGFALFDCLMASSEGTGPVRPAPVSAYSQRFHPFQPQGERQSTGRRLMPSTPTPGSFSSDYGVQPSPPEWSQPAQSRSVSRHPSSQSLMGTQTDDFMSLDGPSPFPESFGQAFDGVMESLAKIGDSFNLSDDLRLKLAEYQQVRIHHIFSRSSFIYTNFCSGRC